MFVQLAVAVVGNLTGLPEFRRALWNRFYDKYYSVSPVISTFILYSTQQISTISFTFLETYFPSQYSPIQQI